MKILLPIFLASEKLNWLTAPLRPLLNQRLQSLSSVIAPSDVVVVTDTEHVFELAEQCGFSAEKKDKASCRTLHECVAEFASDMGFSPEQVVFVFDFRSIGITPESVQRAIEVYEKNPEHPVISVDMPADNPVQFRATYTVIDAGLLHVFDKDQVGKVRDATHLSRPFPLRSHVSGEAGESHTALVREGDTTARLAWIGETATCTGGGEVVGLAASSSALVLVREADGGILIQTSFVQPVVMRVMPFTEDGLASDNPIVVPIHQGQGRLPSLSSDICGYVYTVEEHVSSGEYAASTPFSAHGLALEGSIAGRQDFPELFRYDDILCLGSVSQLRELEELMAAGLVQRLSVCAPDSFTMVTPLDLARFAVWERKNGRTDAGEGGV